MSEYLPASICLNGHIMNSKKSNFQKYCSICGESVISQCNHCNAPLRGDLSYSGFTVEKRSDKKDYYCHSCGKPYPWTERIINSSIELLSLDKDLTDEEKTILKSAIPDLIVETPKTQVAVVKYKNIIAKAQKTIKDAMYQLLVDVVSETIKNSLFPQ